MALNEGALQQLWLTVVVAIALDRFPGLQIKSILLAG